jgi:hypothetical protein
MYKIQFQQQQIKYCFGVTFLINNSKNIFSLFFIPLLLFFQFEKLIDSLLDLRRNLKKTKLKNSFFRPFSNFYRGI